MAVERQGAARRQISIAARGIAAGQARTAIGAGVHRIVAADVDSRAERVDPAVSADSDAAGAVVGIAAIAVGKAGEIAPEIDSADAAAVVGQAAGASAPGAEVIS